MKEPKAPEPPAVVPPKIFAVGFDVAVDCWPKGEEVPGVALAPNMPPDVAFAPEGFEAPLPPAGEKLNGDDIVARDVREGEERWGRKRVQIASGKGWSTRRSAAFHVVRPIATKISEEFWHVESPPYACYSISLYSTFTSLKHERVSPGTRYDGRTNPWTLFSPFNYSALR